MTRAKRNMVLLALCVALALSALACGPGGDLVTGMQNANSTMQGAAEAATDTGLLR